MLLPITIVVKPKFLGCFMREAQQTASREKADDKVIRQGPSAATRGGVPVIAGVAKQSREGLALSGLLRRYAPCNDGRLAKRLAILSRPSLISLGQKRYPYYLLSLIFYLFPWALLPNDSKNKR
jgi:hypothetical protein